MYEKVALSIVEYFISKGVIDKEKKEVYAYGFEIFIAYICYFIIALVIAIITQTLLASLLFFAGFIFVRRSSGGYHASTYIMCHILFALNHFLFIVAYKISPESLYFPFFIIVPVISLLAIFLFAPVDHENKEFSKNEYQYFKNRSRICAVVIVVVTLIGVFFSGVWQFLFSLLFGVFSATVSLITAYYLKKLKG